MNPASPQSQRAFTLVELLAVIAIMVLIAAFLSPAVSTIMRGKELTRATYDIAGLLDMARTEAMTKNTYVFVGFTNAQYKQNWQLNAIAVRSKDGTPYPVIKPSIINYVAISRAIQADNVVAVDHTVKPFSNNSLKAKDSALVSGTSIMSAACTSPVAITVTGTIQATQIIVFTPQGEIIQGNQIVQPTQPTPLITNTTPYVKNLVLALRKSVGLGDGSGNPQNAILDTDMDQAAIVVRGGDGQVQIYQP